MKNKIEDLRNHLFEQMERLNQDDMTPEKLQMEIQRGQAMSELGKVIVDSAKTQILAAKIVGKGKGLKTISEDADDFSQPTVIDRPPAKYSNSGHISTVKKYSEE